MAQNVGTKNVFTLKYYIVYYLLVNTILKELYLSLNLKRNVFWLKEQNIDYGEKVWYFFTPRNRKYQNGSRPNWAASDGYWKANGVDVQIKEKGVIIGFKKTLNFMRGKPP